MISHTLPDGTERPIEFAPCSLNSTQINYSPIEREALGIVWGLNKFHRYVYARDFKLITDHKPLTFIFGQKKGIPEMGVNRINVGQSSFLATDMRLSIA